MFEGLHSPVSQPNLQTSVTAERLLAVGRLPEVDVLVVLRVEAHLGVVSQAVVAIEHARRRVARLVAATETTTPEAGFLNIQSRVICHELGARLGCLPEVDVLVVLRVEAHLGVVPQAVVAVEHASGRVARLVATTETTTREAGFLNIQSRVMCCELGARLVSKFIGSRELTKVSCLKPAGKGDVAITEGFAPFIS